MAMQNIPAKLVLFLCYIIAFLIDLAELRLVDLCLVELCLIDPCFGDVFLSVTPLSVLFLLAISVPLGVPVPHFICFRCSGVHGPLIHCCSSWLLNHGISGCIPLPQRYPPTRVSYSVRNSMQRSR